MKRIATLVIAMVLLVGCGAKQEPKRDRFIVVERHAGMSVYVDRDTGIGYGRIFGSDSLFPLYDVDGELYRPNGWRDIGS